MNTEPVTDKVGQEWAEKAKGTARDAGAAADLYVHEYAWTSVAIIAVVALYRRVFARCTQPLIRSGLLLLRP
jgi:ElaB/YqjD/DUF883 family membrane-anchored ribosome-binding protein